MKSRVFFLSALAFSTVLTISATNSAAEELLKAGDAVPSFTLPYATKDSINFEGLSSTDLAGKRYVLAFYPADWSGGCTAEMCLFRDEFAGFEELGVTVLPISGDYVFSHHEWAKHHSLPFMLLSDPTREFGKAMGVYNPQRGSFQRSVFVIGPEGKLEYVDYEYSVQDGGDFETLQKILQSAAQGKL